MTLCQHFRGRALFFQAAPQCLAEAAESSFRMCENSPQHFAINSPTNHTFFACSAALEPFHLLFRQAAEDYRSTGSTMSKTALYSLNLYRQTAIWHHLKTTSNCFHGFVVHIFYQCHRIKVILSEDYIVCLYNVCCISFWFLLFYDSS